MRKITDLIYRNLGCGCLLLFCWRDKLRIRQNDIVDANYERFPGLSHRAAIMKRKLGGRIVIVVHRELIGDRHRLSIDRNYLDPVLPVRDSDHSNLYAGACLLIGPDFECE